VDGDRTGRHDLVNGHRRSVLVHWGLPGFWLPNPAPPAMKRL
jgi:hypothetical protein